jgi:hypothetical protein
MATPLTNLRTYTTKLKLLGDFSFIRASPESASPPPPSVPFSSVGIHKHLAQVEIPGIDLLFLI